MSTNMYLNLDGFSVLYLGRVVYTVPHVDCHLKCSVLYDYLHSVYSIRYKYFRIIFFLCVQVSVHTLDNFGKGLRHPKILDLKPITVQKSSLSGFIFHF